MATSNLAVQSSAQPESLKQTEASILRPTMYKCPDCGKILPYDTEHFYSNSKRKSGLDVRCKQCYKKRYVSTAAKIKSAAASPKTTHTPTHAPTHAPTLTLDLASMTDDVLIAEVRRRGYTGELRYTKVISV